MIDAEHTAVSPLSGISPEQARDTRARAWVFVFRCWQEKQMTTEPDGRNDVSIRNWKEVSDVDHRPDRPSEVTEPAALPPQKSEILRSTESH
jgi:hypothetical protein